MELHKQLVTIGDFGIASANIGPTFGRNLRGFIIDFLETVDQRPLSYLAKI